MKHINEERLESDLGYRFHYLAEFVGFGEADAAAIHAAAPHLAPLVTALVNAVYAQLRRFDATWRHFVPRQAGYEGPLASSLDELTQDHPLILARKQHLTRYLTALVTRPYDEKMTEYLDTVGKMHTSKAGSPAIVVPLVQMNALLGFVADALTATVLGLGLDRPTELGTLRAFNKLLWIQNDLINRHYQEASEPADPARPSGLSTVTGHPLASAASGGNDGGRGALSALPGAAAVRGLDGRRLPARADARRTARSLPARHGG